MISGLAPAQTLLTLETYPHVLRRFGFQIRKGNKPVLNNRSKQYFPQDANENKIISYTFQKHFQGCIPYYLHFKAEEKKVSSLAN